MSAAPSTESLHPLAEELPMPKAIISDVDPDHLQAFLFGEEEIRSPVEFYRRRLVPASRGNDWLLTSLALRVRNSSETGSWAASVSIEQLPDWYFDLVNRIESLCRHSDGWKGLGSHAPENDTKHFALQMLRKLALERIPGRPSIGLDFEGTFSFSWLDQDVSVDLTVHGDGTYSFFASSAEYSASVDEEPITKPLHSRLLSTLRS